MRLFKLCLLVVGLPLVAGAQVEKTCGVLDSAGGVKRLGSLTLMTSVGQTSGRVFSLGRNAGLTTGYFACHLLRPALDTDRDGLPNELDPDNDGDLLSDEDELAGDSFTPVTPSNPNRADTDGDGVPDGHEAAHGTNPADPGMQLRITHLEHLPNGRWQVSWTARGGMTYRLDWYTDPLSDFPGTDFGVSVPATGGTAPWFETTASRDVPGPAGEDLLLMYVQPR